MLTLNLHRVTRTDIGAVIAHTADGCPFWAQPITVHFEDGSQQLITLYADIADALIPVEVTA